MPTTNLYSSPQDALHKSAATGDLTEFARLVTENEQLLSQMHSISGDSPLTHAILNQQESIIQWVLEHQPENLLALDYNFYPASFYDEKLEAQTQKQYEIALANFATLNDDNAFQLICYSIYSANKDKNYDQLITSSHRLLTPNLSSRIKLYCYIALAFGYLKRSNENSFFHNDTTKAYEYLFKAKMIIQQIMHSSQEKNHQISYLYLLLNNTHTNDNLDIFQRLEEDLKFVLTLCPNNIPQLNDRIYLHQLLISLAKTNDIVQLANAERDKILSPQNSLYHLEANCALVNYLSDTKHANLRQEFTEHAMKYNTVLIDGDIARQVKWLTQHNCSNIAMQLLTRAMTNQHSGCSHFALAKAHNYIITLLLEKQTCAKLTKFEKDSLKECQRQIRLLLANNIIETSTDSEILNLVKTLLTENCLNMASEILSKVKKLSLAVGQNKVLAEAYYLLASKLISASNVKNVHDYGNKKGLVIKSYFEEAIHLVANNACHPDAHFYVEKMIAFLLNYRFDVYFHKLATEKLAEAMRYKPQSVSKSYSLAKAYFHFAYGEMNCNIHSINTVNYLHQAIALSPLDDKNSELSTYNKSLIKCFTLQKNFLQAHLIMADAIKLLPGTTKKNNELSQAAHLLAKSQLNVNEQQKSFEQAIALSEKSLGDSSMHELVRDYVLFLCGDYQAKPERLEQAKNILDEARINRQLPGASLYLAEAYIHLRKSYLANNMAVDAYVAYQSALSLAAENTLQAGTFADVKNLIVHLLEFSKLGKEVLADVEQLNPTVQDNIHLAQVYDSLYFNCIENADDEDEDEDEESLTDEGRKSAFKEAHFYYQKALNIGKNLKQPNDPTELLMLIKYLADVNCYATAEGILFTATQLRKPEKNSLYI